MTKTSASGTTFEVLSDADKLASFVQAVACYLTGWEATASSRYEAVLAHDDLGAITIQIDGWGVQAGRRITANWVSTDPSISDSLGYQARLRGIGATVATGPKKVAAQIRRRLIAEIPEKLREAYMRRDERDAEHYARADIIDTIVAAMPDGERTSATGRFVATAAPEDQREHDRFRARRSLSDTVPRRRAVFEVGTDFVPGKRAVSVNLEYLTPDQARRVAMLVGQF